MNRVYYFLPVVLVSLLLIFPAPVRAGDLEVRLSKDLIDRFLKEATPFEVKYAITPGTTAASIVLDKPRLLLTPGQPGEVRIQLDYLIESPLLGLNPIKGQAKPQVLFEFLPQRGALKIQMKDFVVQAGEKFKLRLDGLIDPTYLPVAPPQPLVMDRKEIKVSAKAVLSRVTTEGLTFSLDYLFQKVETKTD